MLTLITVITLGLIIGIILRIKYDAKDTTIVGCLMISMILGGVIAAIIPSKTVQVTKVSEIVCLKDNYTSEGAFFLGSGQINGVWRYTYYIKKGDSYFIEQINATNVAIQYSKSTPRIEWTIHQLTDDFINKWSFRSVKCVYKENVVIYIPEGSITNKYLLNAK